MIKPQHACQATKAVHRTGRLWQLVSPTEYYADEAAFFGSLFRGENVKTVLELGSGGGEVAWFLKKDFMLTLTDISSRMLAESKKQKP